MWINYIIRDICNKVAIIPKIPNIQGNDLIPHFLDTLILTKKPIQIRSETELHFNQVSRTLIELEKRGFVKCLTPNQKLNRFYQITKKGLNVLEELS